MLQLSQHISQLFKNQCHCKIKNKMWSRRNATADSQILNNIKARLCNLHSIYLFCFNQGVHFKICLCHSSPITCCLAPRARRALEASQHVIMQVHVIAALSRCLMIPKRQSLSDRRRLDIMRRDSEGGSEDSCYLGKNLNYHKLYFCWFESEEHCWRMNPSTITMTQNRRNKSTSSVVTETITNSHSYTFMRYRATCIHIQVAV